MSDPSKDKVKALHLAMIVMENAQEVCSMITEDIDPHNIDVRIYGMERLLNIIMRLIGDEDEKMTDDVGSNKQKAIELLGKVRNSVEKTVSLLESGDNNNEPEILVYRMEKALQKVMNLLE